jgi:phosphoglycerate dehydrogenase-like enzyme
MSVVVTFDPPPELRGVIEEQLADVVYLSQAPRAEALAGADALLAWSLRRELSEEELGSLPPVLVQLFSAGVEHTPFELLPPGMLVAANGGAFAEPMAEHVLGMTLALLKRLLQNQALLAQGTFDRHTLSRELRGSTVAIVGYGGIGRACGSLFEAFGAAVVPVTRENMGDLLSILPGADVVLVSVPLSKETRGLIGARELEAMKPDAILINVARGPIVDEDALYAHLQREPAFSAALDVWWDEPADGEPFRPRHPFLELPNVLGSPHNSGDTFGAFEVGARRAAENVARYLRGEQPLHLVERSEYVS